MLRISPRGKKKRQRRESLDNSLIEEKLNGVSGYKKQGEHVKQSGDIGVEMLTLHKDETNGKELMEGNEVRPEGPSVAT